MKPVCTFKVYPTRRRGNVPCFEVVVAKNLREVRGMYGRYAGDLIAFVRMFKEGKSGDGRLGVIVFSRRHCGSQITAHEAAHAAMKYLAWKRYGWKGMYGKVVKWQEETICHVIGLMNAQIVNGLWKHGVYKK